MAKTVDLDIPHDPAERERRQRNFLVGNEAKLMAEIERLKAERDRAYGMGYESAKTEIERLRAALTEARKLASRAGPPDLVRALNEIETLASKTLNEQSTPQKKQPSHRNHRTGWPEY